MRRGMRGLEAAALVDRDIDDHRAFLHVLQHVPRDELRRAGAGHQNGADHHVGREHLLLDRLNGGVARPDAAHEQIVELAKPGQRLVEHAHVRAEPRRHARGMCADDTAAEDGNTRRLHAGHAAEEKTASAIDALERHSRSLDRKPPRYLAHWRKQREMPARIGDCLVGDGAHAGFHQPMRLPRIGREMQIREKNLPRREAAPLFRLRFLHLHDHLRLGEDLRRVLRNRRASLGVDGIVGAYPGARIMLDDNVVAGGHIFAHGAGRQPDPKFLRLDLLGDTDPHGTLHRFSSFVAQRARRFRAISDVGY